MSARLGRWDGTTAESTILDEDKLTGGASGYTRHYLDMMDNWSGGFTQFSYAHNRIPVIAVHSWDGQRNAIQWNAVANGDYDSSILAHAKDFKALSGRNVPAYLVFHHEPENEADGKVSGDISGTCGTPAEFRAAAARFHSVIRQVLTKSDAWFGTTLMAGSWRSGRYVDWLPSAYDFVGIDGYNHGSTKETFSSIITPAHTAATKLRTKLFIEELGCEEVATSPSFKANFFAEMASLAKSWPELIGIEYSNVQAKGNYRIDTSAISLAAWKAVATNAYFKGTWT